RSGFVVSKSRTAPVQAESDDIIVATSPGTALLAARNIEVEIRQRGDAGAELLLRLARGCNGCTDKGTAVHGVDEIAQQQLMLRHRRCAHRIAHGCPNLRRG